MNTFCRKYTIMMLLCTKIAWKYYMIFHASLIRIKYILSNPITQNEKPYNNQDHYSLLSFLSFADFSGIIVTTKAPYSCGSRSGPTSRLAWSAQKDSRRRKTKTSLLLDAFRSEISNTCCLQKGIDKLCRPISGCVWRSSLFRIFPGCY